MEEMKERYVEEKKCSTSKHRGGKKGKDKEMQGVTKTFVERENEIRVLRVCSTVLNSSQVAYKLPEDTVFVCLSVRPSVRLSVCLSVCLSVIPATCSSLAVMQYPVCPSMWRFMCLSVHLFVCMCVPMCL